MCSSSGGQLYEYNFWYNHCVLVAVRYAGQEGTSADLTVSDNRHMIYFVNCNWVETGGSSTVHIYTQTIHRTTQRKQKVLEECGPCPVFASYTLAFALQLRKKQSG